MTDIIRWFPAPHVTTIPDDEPSHVHIPRPSRARVDDTLETAAWSAEPEEDDQAA